jgi:hypothetical protein
MATSEPLDLLMRADTWGVDSPSNRMHRPAPPGDAGDPVLAIFGRGPRGPQFDHLGWRSPYETTARLARLATSPISPSWGNPLSLPQLTLLSS